MNSIIQHLRFPFSILLMPVFLLVSLELGFAGDNFSWQSWVLVFIALHLFIYPSSNAYNSYQDSDEGSIGLIKNTLKKRARIYSI